MQAPAVAKGQWPLASPYGLHVPLHQRRRDWQTGSRLNVAALPLSPDIATLLLAQRSNHALCQESRTDTEVKSLIGTWGIRGENKAPSQEGSSMAAAKQGSKYGVLT